LPKSSSKRFATGARVYFSITCPFGLPKWLIKITAAPLSSAYLIVGKAALILLSDSTTPFFTGTLKSTRINALLPAKSRSSINNLDIKTPLFFIKTT
jgi:hypothetical protein